MIPYGMVITAVRTVRFILLATLIRPKSLGINGVSVAESVIILLFYVLLRGMHIGVNCLGRGNVTLSGQVKEQRPSQHSCKH